MEDKLIMYVNGELLCRRNKVKSSNQNQQDFIHTEPKRRSELQNS